MFTPPTGPLVLTRTVHRGLSGGKEVVTRRRYSVHFVPEDNGFRVDGSLIDVTVDAPVLTGLAEIERKRVNPDLFPIHLDAAGQIVATPPPTPSTSQQPAARLVIQQLSVLPAAQRGEAQAFVSALLASGGARSEWPRDLFHPAPGAHRDTRKVAMAEGEGTVTISTEARASAATGLLEAFERVIVTEFEGSRRETREEWLLALKTE